MLRGQWNQDWKLTVGFHCPWQEHILCNAMMEWKLNGSWLCIFTMSDSSTCDIEGKKRISFKPCLRFFQASIQQGQGS